MFLITGSNVIRHDASQYVIFSLQFFSFSIYYLYFFPFLAARSPHYFSQL